MCHGFQITYFNIQQLSMVLMIALLEHFNLEVNEKVSFRSNDSKLGMLFLKNISLALLRRETYKILMTSKKKKKKKKKKRQPGKQRNWLLYGTTNKILMVISYTNLIYS